MRWNRRKAVASMIEGVTCLAAIVALTTAAAAQGGVVTVTMSGLTVKATVVAVLARMPTFGPRFLVADRTAVAAWTGEHVQPDPEGTTDLPALPV